MGQLCVCSIRKVTSCRPPRPTISRTAYTYLNMSRQVPIRLKQANQSISPRPSRWWSHPMRPLTATLTSSVYATRRLRCLVTRQFGMKAIPQNSASNPSFSSLTGTWTLRQPRPLWRLSRPSRARSAGRTPTTVWCSRQMMLIRPTRFTLSRCTRVHVMVAARPWRRTLLSSS